MFPNSFQVLVTRSTIKREFILVTFLKAKKAIAQLTKENCELDVRIAVIEHEISQQSLKMAQATH